MHRRCRGYGEQGSEYIAFRPTSAHIKSVHVGSSAKSPAQPAREQSFSHPQAVLAHAAHQSADSVQHDTLRSAPGARHAHTHAHGRNVPASPESIR